MTTSRRGKKWGGFSFVECGVTVCIGLIQSVKACSIFRIQGDAAAAHGV